MTSWDVRTNITFLNYIVFSFYEAQTTCCQPQSQDNWDNSGIIITNLPSMFNNMLLNVTKPDILQVTLQVILHATWHIMKSNLSWHASWYATWYACHATHLVRCPIQFHVWCHVGFYIQCHEQSFVWCFVWILCSMSCQISFDLMS